MITQSLEITHITSWEAILGDAIRDAQTLQAYLQLPERPSAFPACNFPIRVPQPYLSRIKMGDWDDPLLKQIWADVQELDDPEGSLDPIEESNANPVPGLLHKFSHRVLLIASPSCPIHCRYCFRRSFPYEKNAGLRRLEGALSYIQSHTEIEEVILSGGDPLMLPDMPLLHLLEKIAAIAHIKCIRIHTRFPVVIPQRVTTDLLKGLNAINKPISMVLHINHPNELDQEVHRICLALSQAGVRLFSQSVLLEGVNNDAQVLIALMYRLWASGVQPYYIHLLDHVTGSGHFKVGVEQARVLEQALSSRLPGYLVPRFVKEIPKMPHKIALSSL